MFLKAVSIFVWWIIFESVDRAKVNDHNRCIVQIFYLNFEHIFQINFIHTLWAPFQIGRWLQLDLFLKWLNDSWFLQSGKLDKLVFASMNGALKLSVHSIFIEICVYDDAMHTAIGMTESVSQPDALSSNRVQISKFMLSAIDWFLYVPYDRLFGCVLSYWLKWQQPTMVVFTAAKNDDLTLK